MNAATRAVIERLLNALEEETSLLNKCRAREGHGPMEPMPLVAEARALLEEPASEDARPAREGFVLVPVEPTEAILAAGVNTSKNGPWSYRNCYKAMITAAGKE